MTELSIIIVTYNNQTEIKTLLGSLLKYQPKNSEVIVVDNSSSDNTKAVVREFKEVKLVESGNLGFAKGSNLGVDSSTGEYLLFLNPDTEIKDTSVDLLLSFIKAHPEVGIVAPSLILPDGSIQPSVSKFPTLIGAVKEHLLSQDHQYSEFVPSQDLESEIEVVYGAAIIIKKENFIKMRGFDERYFLYFEDIDLCRKVKKAGLKIFYLPQAQVVHALGKSVAQVKNSSLSFGVRTLSWFIPIKGSSNYNLVKSSYIYHGFLEGVLLRSFLYIVGKLGRIR